MNKIIILTIAFLVAACNQKSEPTAAELKASQLAAEKLAIEKKSAEKAANEKLLQDSIVKAKDNTAENIDRLRATDVIAKFDTKLAEELKAPIISSINKEFNQKKKDEKESEKIAKKQKKKEGVRIGMTMQDVLDSSWGRPQHATTYHTSLGEHTIWQYGQYGERGTISFENGIINMIQN